MNVIVEGIDNTGKTTLAKAISRDLSIEFMDRTKLGRGVPTSFEQVVDRAERYLQEDGVVFDRHTCITQPIYGMLRDDPDLPKALLDAFYNEDNIIIYARCTGNVLVGHEPSPGDTEEHLRDIGDNYGALLAAYDKWAIEHAHIIYTNYNQTKLITRMVGGAFKR